MLGQRQALGVLGLGEGREEALNSALGRASIEGFLEEVRLNESQLVRRSFLRVLGRACPVSKCHLHSHGDMRKHDSFWEFQRSN